MPQYLTPDQHNRVSLKRLTGGNPASHYRVTEHPSGTIILTPATDREIADYQATKDPA